MTMPSDSDLEAVAVQAESLAAKVRGWKAGTTVPTPPADPLPTPTTGGLADRGRFKLNRAEYFDLDAAEGEFLAKYKGRMTAYPANFLDTQGKKGSGSHYDPNNVSVKDGFCKIHCRTGKDGKAGAAATQLTDSAGKVLTQLYGRWEERTRSDAVSGYKRATMLWPGSYQWNDGEVDWIEGSLNGSIHGFNHYPGSPASQDSIDFGSVKSTDWHTYAVEWTPGLVSFFVDDKLVGTSKKAPTKPMFFNDQIETNIGGTQPTSKDDGFVYVDYIGQWSYTG